jgi:hypothetical protein
MEEIQAFCRKNPNCLQASKSAPPDGERASLSRQANPPEIVMTKTFCLSALVLAGLLAPPLGPARAQQGAGLRQELVAVQVRSGASMTYLGLVGSARPAAAVVLVAGGDGGLGLGHRGSIGTDLRLNFLIRSRELFARQGLYAAALDVASDLDDGMDGAYRLSLQHAKEIGQVIAHLRGRLGVPVWLIGTSSSSMSAVNAAARLPVAGLPGPHGIVLASSQTVLTAYCGRTVYDAPLGAIRGPVLLVSHRDDGCACSPGSASAGGQLVAALTAASAKEHKIFTGGLTPVSGPCHARAPHGFFGIEERVVKAIADWIKAH